MTFYCREYFYTAAFPAWTSCGTAMDVDIGVWMMVWVGDLWWSGGYKSCLLITEPGRPSYSLPRKALSKRFQRPNLTNASVFYSRLVRHGEWTGHFSRSTEPCRGPNVCAERNFQKISQRNSWSPNFLSLLSGAFCIRQWSVTGSFRKTRFTFG